ncbi:MAG: four helix bundle protein [Candidatus Uhrbacteria bacterium]
MPRSTGVKDNILVNAIPLLAALTRFWNETEEQVRHFPKRDTQLLGRTMLDDIDACILHVLRALQDGAGRRRWLVESSAHFDRAKLKIRIAVKRELISDRWYAAHLDMLAEIGKMIGGWQRTTPPQRL